MSHISVTIKATPLKGPTHCPGVVMPSVSKLRDNIPGCQVLCQLKSHEETMKSLLLSPALASPLKKHTQIMVQENDLVRYPRPSV